MIEFVNSLTFLTFALTVIFFFQKQKFVGVFLFFLFFYNLFFPIGFIRAYFGYPSVIGFDLLKHEELLLDVSLLVFVGQIFFILGFLVHNSIKSRSRVDLFSKELVIYKRRLKLFLIFIITLSLALLFSFILSLGSIFDYFDKIDSVRQTLSGQMFNFFIYYFIFFVALYRSYLLNKLDFIFYLMMIISVISFALYGFRGPVLGIFILYFILLQSLGLFRVGINFRTLILMVIPIVFFIVFQLARTTTEINDPLWAIFLERFNGYDPLVVIYNKVVLGQFFSFQTFFNNIQSLVDLPIPRGIFPYKSEPVSLTLSASMFNDVGDREFVTGGISPTILGSLIWNFNILGLLGMFAFGFVVSKIEKMLRNGTVMDKLFSIMFSMFLLLCVEAPENSFGVLWFIILSYVFIYVLHYSLFIKR